MRRTSPSESPAAGGPPGGRISSSPTYPRHGSTFRGGVGKGRKGNEGTAAAVARTSGSITYAEWSFAKKQGLDVARVLTTAGSEPVSISAESVARSIAAVTARGPDSDLVLDMSALYRPTRLDAYPIILAAYQVVCSRYPDSQIASAIRKFLAVALEDAQHRAADLGYAPVPDWLKDRLLTAVAAIT